MILGTRSNRSSMAIVNKVLKRMSDNHATEAVELKIVAVDDSKRDGPFVVQRMDEFTTLHEKIGTGEIDAMAVAVDEIPLDPTAWSQVAAVLPRGPAEDVLVSALSLERMRPGSVIGISSARQKSQLLNLRPDLCVKDMREETNRCLDIGNGLDAFIVSRAGMELLQIDCPAYILDPEQFIPSPGQGAIAILCGPNSRHWKTLTGFDDHDTRICVESERFLLNAVSTDISVPIGIWATNEENEIRVRAIVLDDDGMTSFRLDRNIELVSLEDGLNSFAKELRYSWDLVR